MRLGRVGRYQLRLWVYHGPVCPVKGLQWQPALQLKEDLQHKRIHMCIPMGTTTYTLLTADTSCPAVAPAQAHPSDLLDWPTWASDICDGTNWVSHPVGLTMSTKEGTGGSPVASSRRRGAGTFVG
uniref:Uncharacterized protein n=1 Tax=Eutreptiella gymnastica TaxID=73025 RepID=A0A7S1I6W3_9EUGL|mmetsp:Transcript_133800/g.232126  ORF Transcript_133800/g.232126 Transcript_133800/m.232126 type:complete len:126 (+) Transcript_133800:288-665(+)